MSTKAQVKTQVKSPTAPAAAHIPQPPVPEPEHVAERPDIGAQLEGAARLGHSLGAVSVDRSAPRIIQRQEIPEGEEEELQLKRELVAIQRQVLPEEEEEELMMMPEEGRVGPQGGQVPPEVEAAIRRARGGGQPLEGALQEQMSASLGHDFSGVRVHTDSEADALNYRLQAKAFTTGPDIFFKRGAYEPGSSGGRELIAHELSHAVQQGAGRVTGGGSGMKVHPAGGGFEREADEMARGAATGSWINQARGGGQSLGRGVQTMMSAEPSPGHVWERVGADPVAGDGNGILDDRTFASRTARVRKSRGHFTPTEGAYDRRDRANRMPGTPELGERIWLGQGGRRLLGTGGRGAVGPGVARRGVASKEGLATPTRLHRASQSIQRWEWDNVPATFRTENTENNAGDSEYSVLAADYMRYAPINTLRNLPDQVYLRGERCFAYFGAAQVKPIMGQADDSKLAVDVAAQGTGIKVKDVVNRTEAAGSRVPWVGATVFDAARCAGKWKQGDVHVGHNVKDLGKPLPNISNPAWVAKQKWVRR